MKKIFNITAIAILIAVISINPSLAQTFKSLNDSATVKVTINYDQMNATDQLALYYTTVAPVPSSLGQTGVLLTMAKKVSTTQYRFQFFIPNKKHLPGSYVTIMKIKTEKNEKGDNQWQYQYTDASHIILDQYFVEAGDNLQITISKKPQFDSRRSTLNNFFYHFTGKGSEKYNIRHHIDSVRYSKDFYYDFINSDSTFNAKNGEANLGTSLEKIVKPYRGKISEEAYNELRIHSLYSAKIIEYVSVRYYLKRRYKNISASVRAKLCDGINENDLELWKRFSPHDLTASVDFGQAELEKYRLIGYCRDEKWSPDSFFKELSKIDNAFIREQLMILAAKVYAINYLDYSNYISQISKFIRTKNGNIQLAGLLRAEKGSKAYNFRLTDLQGNKINLEDFRGKVVFIDFWYTGCGSCADYYNGVLSKVEDKFKSNPDYVFVSISIDKNMTLWKKSVTEGNYTSMQAKNLFTNGRGAASEIINFFNVSSYPSPFIIDRNQRIFERGVKLRDELPLISALESAAKN